MADLRPEDVELVARALSGTSIQQFGERLRHRREPLARAAVEALADRLHPSVVSERVEYGWMIGDLSICTFDEMVRRQLTMADRRYSRLVQTLEDGRVVIWPWEETK